MEFIVASRKEAMEAKVRKARLEKEAGKIMNPAVFGEWAKWTVIAHGDLAGPEIALKYKEMMDLIEKTAELKAASWNYPQMGQA
jgi:hypothetical protein